MAGLQLKITAAGRAAIVNLPNTGTNAVTVSQIGVTATAFDPVSATALPGELKRLSTFSGMAVADDTIHVTLRDESADVYSLRGFALYLADGTLFAIYGQAGVILEKSAQAMLLLSADVKFADIDAASIEFGDAVFVNPPASETVQGSTQYATNEGALQGSAKDRSIVASTLKYVLDSRFGAGAPTTFVKGLLAIATAAAMRAALEIKSAALSESSDFAPATHGHGIGSIAGLQGALDAKQPSGSYAAASHSHDAGHIVSGTFAPARISQSSVVQHQGALSIDWPQVYNAGQLGGWRSIAPSTKANLAGDTFTGQTNYMVGDVGQQSILQRFGWNNGIARWNWVMEPDGSLSLWSYSATGVSATQTVTFKSPAAGGGPVAMFIAGQVVWNASNFTPASKATLGVDVTFRDVVSDRGNNTGVIWFGAVAQNRYLFWDGGQYTFGGGVGGADTIAWHSGNFNPGTKADLSGANFTGHVTMPSLNATSSDARLKTDISDLRDCLATVLRLRPRSWKWIEDGEEDFGFIAQEHRKVLAGAVHESDDEMRSLFVRYGKAEALLVGSVHEIVARLEALEQRTAVA